MIDKASFSQLKTNYPFIAYLPDKLQDLIAREIPPEQEQVTFYKVKIEGKNGCLLLVERKLIAFWTSKLLFKKFPTMQEFSFAQVNELKNQDSNDLYIHSSADPTIKNEDYEEGKFSFESSAERDAVMGIIRSKSPRLATADTAN